MSLAYTLLVKLSVKAFVFAAVIFICGFAGGMPAAADTTLVSDQAPLATPTSGWLVGPSSLVQEQGQGGSCLLMNQFDDSSVIRFAGNQDGLLALAADFRTSAFNPGDVHIVTLGLGNIFQEELQGRAFSDSVLLVNLSEVQNIYDALRRASILQISLSGKAFDYALLGISDGLNRFDDCVRASGKGVQRQSLQPNLNAPIASQQSQEAIAPIYESTATQSTQSQPLPMADDALTPLPAAESNNSSGDVMASIGQAEAALRPYNQVNRAQATAVPMSAQEKKSSHSNAVKIKNARPRDILVNLPSQQPQASDILAQNDTSSATAAADMERRWRAIKGANLREVLDVWTRSANVDLLWQAEQEYPVKTSVIFQGNFESAVMGLLSQYNGDDKVRPTGRLFNDPILGGKVLLIKSRNDN